ncbi:MAG: hypothetical protein ACM3MN_00430 [Nitrospirota bacterium]
MPRHRGGVFPYSRWQPVFMIALALAGVVASFLYVVLLTRRRPSELFGSSTMLAALVASLAGVPEEKSESRQALKDRIDAFSRLNKLVKRRLDSLRRALAGPRGFVSEVLLFRSHEAVIILTIETGVSRLISERRLASVVTGSG